MAQLIFKGENSYRYIFVGFWLLNDINLTASFLSSLFFGVCFGNFNLSKLVLNTTGFKMVHIFLCQAAHTSPGLLESS